ncbi:hypothetical protein FPV67DRAFT_1457006 [Lyophyllum atratum]|nr:hypothetical protein FPV67DRAFT_1457006 [Lyophyllum atratum]
MCSPRRSWTLRCGGNEQFARNLISILTATPPALELDTTHSPQPVADTHLVIPWPIDPDHPASIMRSGEMPTEQHIEEIFEAEELDVQAMFEAEETDENMDMD